MIVPPRGQGRRQEVVIPELFLCVVHKFVYISVFYVKLFSLVSIWSNPSQVGAAFEKP